MHTFQTWKINLGVNAITSATDHHAAREVKWIRWPLWPHSACRRVEKPGCWIPTDCQRKRNRNGRFLMMRKLTNRIKTDSSHTVKGQKEKEKRSIWSETTTLIVSCWPFIGPPVQDAWGRAVLLGEVTLMANGPCLGTPVTWSPQQDPAEALSASAPQPQYPGLPTPSGSLFSYEASSPSRYIASSLHPSLSLCNWLALGFHKIFEICLLG